MVSEYGWQQSYYDQYTDNEKEEDDDYIIIFIYFEWELE